MSASREEQSPRRCDACQGEITASEEAGWECECGIVVCKDPACFEECFKAVAGGEETRCRACGVLT